MNLSIEIESIVAPTQLRIRIETRDFYYRDRYSKWKVQEVVDDWTDLGKVIDLNDGNSSVGDGILQGITRVLEAANIQQMLMDEVLSK
jgi:hypothetical protein